MKKLLTFIFLAVLLQGVPQSWAQTNKPEAMKEGYAMHEGKMVQIADGAISPMSADVTMENGTKVMQDGTVILPGKKAQKLREGYAVNKLGKIVLVEYDMMTYDAIQKHSQKMLGNTETQIVIGEDGTAVVVDAANSEEIMSGGDAFARKSALINERNTLVVQKANLMNKLSMKEAEKDEDLKRINARLKQVEQELKSLVPQEQKSVEPMEQKSSEPIEQQSEK